MFLPVKVVKEGQEIKCQLDPTFFLAFVQSVCIHNAGGVVEARTAHDRPMKVPVDVITNEWSIYQK